MIRVDAAGTRRLSLITAQNGAVTAVGGSSFLTTTSEYTDLAPVYTTISSATTTSIDAAPAANTISDYDFVSVKNTFAGSHTMTLQVISGSGGPFPLKTFTLLTDESMNYAHGTGFQFFDASGNLKESIAAATNWAVSGNLSVGATFTNPTQPSFLATKSADTNDVTGDGTTYTIICNTEVNDRTGEYDNATGIYTAGVTGDRIFAGSVWLRQIGVLHTGGFAQVVTTGRTFSFNLMNYGAMKDVNNELVLAFCTPPLPMAATDTAVLKVNVSGSTKTVDVGGSGMLTSFGGRLLG